MRNHYRSLPDEELLTLLEDDDHLAFTEIYERYKGPLYLHARHILGNREEVRDVLQQLFSELWNRRHVLRIEKGLGGYLYSATRNSALKVIARKKTASDYFSSLAAFAVSEESFQTDHLVRERQMIELIEKEIALLPPKMREIFEMSRKGGMSYREIARQLCLSEKTVKNQAFNALKILRQKLGPGILICLLAGGDPF